MSSTSLATTAATAVTPARRSLATELEQRRLAHRAARIRQALGAMRRIADGRSEAPAALLHGIRDFDHELADVERRLRDLQGSSAQLH